MHSVPFQKNPDLRRILDFDVGNGRITLAQERMLVFRQTAFGLLRKLMCEQLGGDVSRMLLAKFGYAHGTDDYWALADQLAAVSDEERLMAGPMMHALNGLVRVEARCVEVDRSRGHFYFRGFWHNSYEAEVYKTQVGRSTLPVCHTLTGYGSGWCTAFFGRPMLEIERRCIACGDEVCEWEIKPWEEWGSEADPWKHSLSSSGSSIYQDLLNSNQKIADINRNLEAEVLARTKENQRLLRVLCHDLRTPLVAIEHAYDKLHDSSSKLQDPEAWDTLKQCLDSMKSTINLVRASEGPRSLASNLEIFPVRFTEALRTVELMYQSRLCQKNLKIELTNHLTAHDTLRTNPLIFSSNILSNVLGNAIKFSPRDGKIWITAERCDAMIVMTVRDEGVGIPHRLRSMLLNRDSLPSTPGTSGETGTGFGLGIVRSYLALFGGRLEISSQTIEEDSEAHGTTVKLYVPVYREE